MKADLLTKKDIPYINEINRVNPSLVGEFTNFCFSQYAVGVYEDGKLVSIAFVNIYDRNPTKDYPKGRLADLNSVFTLDAYRGRGYARACIERIISLCSDFGCDYIHIDSVSTAVEFYKKLGFFTLSSDKEQRMFYDDLP